MDERLKFVARVLDGEKMAVLCRDFGISRKTGYKIFNRYKDDGLEALTDRSRRPVRYANQLPDQIERTIVTTKKDKPHWGARKIRELLIRRLAGDVRIPSKSTVNAVLDRHGLVKRARQRRRFTAEGTQLSQAAVPNALWCTVPAGRRPLLLPPDGHRPGLALPARLRSARIDEGRSGHRGLHPPVQGTRPACRHQERQRPALRLSWSTRPGSKAWSRSGVTANIEAAIQPHG
jgi:transposase